MYYQCSENKGPEQLRGYREADLRLCFRMGKNPVFSRRGSNLDGFFFQPIPSRHENGVMKEITATSDYSFYHNSILTNKTAVPAHHTQMSVELDCYHDYTFEISAVNEIGAGDRVSKFNIPRVRHGKLCSYGNSSLGFY